LCAKCVLRLRLKITVCKTSNESVTLSVTWRLLLDGSADDAKYILVIRALFPEDDANLEVIRPIIL